jgi:hypothetical protein
MTATEVDLARERSRAVAACLDEARTIIGKEGVSRPTLERVKRRLIALASRHALFSSEQFPLLHERSTMHVLAEDPDGLTLYAVVAAQGQSATPPHDPPGPSSSASRAKRPTGSGGASTTVPRRARRGSSRSSRRWSRPGPGWR